MTVIYSGTNLQIWGWGGAGLGTNIIGAPYNIWSAKLQYKHNNFWNFEYTYHFLKNNVVIWSPPPSISGCPDPCPECPPVNQTLHPLVSSLILLFFLIIQKNVKLANYAFLLLSLFFFSLMCRKGKSSVIFCFLFIFIRCNFLHEWMMLQIFNILISIVPKHIRLAPWYSVSYSLYMKKVSDTNNWY